MKIDDHPTSASQPWLRMNRWVFRTLQVNSIRTRLLIILVFVVVLTAFVISGTSALVSYWDRQQYVLNQLEAVAVAKETEIRTWTDNLQTDLRALLSQQDVILRVRSQLKFFVSDVSRLQRDLEEDLMNMVNVTGRFEEIFLMNREGKVIASSNLEQKGKIFSQEPFFQEGLKGPYIQPATYYPALDRTSIIVVAPVFDQDGKTVLGVMAGRANLNYLNQIMIERTGLGDTGEAYLVGLNRALLTESRFPGYQPLKTYIRTDGTNKSLTERLNDEGLYPDYRGVQVVGVYRWLPQLQVALLAEQDQAEAFNPIYTALIRDIGIALGVVILFVTIGLFMTRNITDPLIDLAGIANRIAAGNLGLVVNIPRNDEIGELAHAFNSMTAQLRSLIENLEERIQERTQALEAGALISRQITTILDIDELLSQVVNNLQTTFNYYHVHIYLIDEATGELVMREGSGEAGRKLKAQGHKLPRGRGIVGTVAERAEPFLARDVNQIPNFIRNPHLSRTQAELAVPLRKGKIILGVLDIQSEELGDFSEQELTLMQSIADQIAVALDNARLFQNLQAAATEAEELTRRITRETWQEIGSKAETTGYTFTKQGLIPATNDWLPAMDRAVSQKSLVQYADENGNGATEAAASVAIPLILRGEVIGVIGIERPVDRTWSEDEMMTIEAITEQVALALDAARLARETERAAWRDQVVSESTAKVWSSAELEEVMRAAVAQLGDKLQASEVVIRLGTETQLTQS
jgi:GAF domain-containing protein/HAMP domain-containing protein